MIDEIKFALQQNDDNKLNELLWALEVTPSSIEHLDFLHDLLLNPHHQNHQVVARKLQFIKNPASIPVVVKVLESNFNYLAYTCSEPQVIAKWFSWILYAIGTPEAIKEIHRFAQSKNEGIAKEMKYRLGKMSQS